MVNNPKIIEFSIPGFESQEKINYILLSFMDKDPDKFNDDIKITSCYDSFTCVWNGGRSKTLPLFKDKIVGTLDYLNHHGIELRYTFTNLLIDQNLEVLNDYTANKILEITKEYQIMKTRINVSSNNLKDYISEKYPDTFYFMWSTTKDIKSINDINCITKTEMLVPSYDVNNNFDIIDQFSHPENIELLCCEPCIEFCSNRKAHYESISRNQMHIDSKSFECPNNCEFYSYYDVVPKRRHYISIDDIRNKYLPLGINKFKITGRVDLPLNIIENYVNFLVKPEYKDEVRYKMLTRFLYEN